MMAAHLVIVHQQVLPTCVGLLPARHAGTSCILAEFEVIGFYLRVNVFYLSVIKGFNHADSARVHVDGGLLPEQVERLFHYDSGSAEEAVSGLALGYSHEQAEKHTSVRYV